MQNKDIMNDAFLNIVLFEPEIPYNTGNIGRLCVGMNSVLHLIEPLGFKITDRLLKRAGLDYWDLLDLKIYGNLDEFFQKNDTRDRFYFASTRAGKIYYQQSYSTGDYIMFGKETAGLPECIHTEHKEKGIFIPMSKNIRSLNLSNSVAVIMYEAFRQIKNTEKNTCSFVI